MRYIDIKETAEGRTITVTTEPTAYPIPEEVWDIDDPEEVGRYCTIIIESGCEPKPRWQTWNGKEWSERPPVAYAPESYHEI